MKVTKEQKVFIGLLIIGLIALAVDRLVLTPASAEASDDSASLLVARTPAAAASAPSAKASAPATATNPIADKLVALSDSLHLADGPMKDSFATPQAWIEKPAPPPPAPPAPVKPPPPPFDTLHTLSGVMVSGLHPAAMIDGKLVSVGQYVDGYKLISVTPGMAVLRHGDQWATLRTR